MIPDQVIAGLYRNLENCVCREFCKSSKEIFRLNSARDRNSIQEETPTTQDKNVWCTENWDGGMRTCQWTGEDNKELSICDLCEY